MPKIAAIAAVLAVATLLIAAAFRHKAASTQGAKTEMSTVTTPAALPPIDLLQPATLETATFAMG